MDFAAFEDLLPCIERKKTPEKEAKQKKTPECFEVYHPENGFVGL